MTRCIFHDTTPATQERQLFELVEQSYKNRERVLVYSENEERAAALDRLLWIMKQEAFIPHKILQKRESGPPVPVAIVTSEIQPTDASVLIADGHCMLDYAARFDVVHEFVNRSSPQLQQACRDRFRDYRARQIAVEYSK